MARYWVCYAVACLAAVADAWTTRMALDAGFKEGGLLGRHVSPLVRDLLVALFLAVFGLTGAYYRVEGAWMVWLLIAGVFTFAAVSNYRKAGD